MKKVALAQVFSCEFREISKNTFTERLWATASKMGKRIKNRAKMEEAFLVLFIVLYGTATLNKSQNIPKIYFTNTHDIYCSSTFSMFQLNSNDFRVFSINMSFTCILSNVLVLWYLMFLCSGSMKCYACWYVHPPTRL